MSPGDIGKEFMKNKINYDGIKEIYINQLCVVNRELIDDKGFETYRKNMSILIVKDQNEMREIIEAILKGNDQIEISQIINFKKKGDNHE